MFRATVRGQGADGVGLVHDQQHTAMLGELAQHRADGLLVLFQRLVVQGVPVMVEGVRVVRALAHVQADPHVDVVRGHHRSSRHEGFPVAAGSEESGRPRRTHITTRPAPCAPEASV